MSGGRAYDGVPHRERATILVVEDEALVRADLTELLRQYDFNVIEAGSAAEAIGAIGGQDIDLVFSDIRMPGPIDSFGLAEWIRQHHPTIRVILTSGSADAAKQASVVCAEGQFLMKPYCSSDVIKRMRELIASRPN